MIDPRGGPSAHPALDRPGLVAGIGLRARASASDVLSLLDTCLTHIHADRTDLVALVTLDARGDHPALRSAAEALGLPVLALPPAELARDVPNPSPVVAVLADVASVAEAAALAFGPLVLEKQRSANCTCALARYTPSRSRAASASSTLATSSAGP